MKNSLLGIALRLAGLRDIRHLQSERIIVVIAINTTQQGMQPNGRKTFRLYNTITCNFSRLKDVRRSVTRYNKPTKNLIASDDFFSTDFCW